MKCPYENKQCTDQCRYAGTCIQRKEREDENKRI